MEQPRGHSVLFYRRANAYRARPIVGAEDGMDAAFGGVVGSSIRVGRARIAFTTIVGPDSQGLFRVQMFGHAAVVVLHCFLRY